MTLHGKTVTDLAVGVEADHAVRDRDLGGRGGAHARLDLQYSTVI